LLIAHDLILKGIHCLIHHTSSSFRNLITLKFMGTNFIYFWLVSHVIEIRAWRRLIYSYLTWSFGYLGCMTTVSRFVIFVWTWLTSSDNCLFGFRIDECKLFTILIVIKILELLVILIVFFLKNFNFWRFFIIAWLLLQDV